MKKSVKYTSGTCSECNRISDNLTPVTNDFSHIYYLCEECYEELHKSMLPPTEEDVYMQYLESIEDDKRAGVFDE